MGGSLRKNFSRTLTKADSLFNTLVERDPRGTLTEPLSKTSS